MAVARLDASTSVAAATLSYAVSAGTDRCLIVFTSSEIGTGPTSVTAVDYGGQAMIAVYESMTADAGFQAGTSCWYLLDAGIAAASGTTITPTYSSAPADEIIYAASYTGVHQSGGATTVPQTATAETNEATPNPFTTIDLTETSDGLIVASIGCGNATTYTWQSDMTEQEDTSDASSSGSFADRLSTTNANVTIEATVASQNRAAAGSAEFAATPSVLYEVVGVVKNNAGTPVNGADVYLFKESPANTFTFQDHTTSAGSGNYTFGGLLDNDANYHVQAKLDGSPNVFDCTDHVLTPVVE